MADEKLVEFARHRLRFGTPEQDVAVTLRINGLSEEEIREVLSAAQATSVPTPLPPSPALTGISTEASPALPVVPVSDPPVNQAPPVTVMPSISPRVTGEIETTPKPYESAASTAASMPQASPNTPEVPAALIYAGFWRRVIAAVIDGVILTFLYAAIVIGVSLSLGISDAQSLAEYLRGTGGIVTAITLFVLVLYHPLFEASPMQGSLGKHFVGLFVTDMEGHRIGFWRALMRNLAKVTSSVVLCIGYLMIAFTKRKQGLHDLIAGCLVLKHEHHQEG